MNINSIGIKQMKKLILAFLLTALVVPAQAAIVSKTKGSDNLFIKQLGIDRNNGSNTGYGYISFESIPTTTDCPSGVIYFDLSTFGKSAFAAALSAKMAQLQLSSASFDTAFPNPEGSGVVCSLVQMEFAE